MTFLPKTLRNRWLMIPKVVKTGAFCVGLFFALWYAGSAIQTTITDRYLPQVEAHQKRATQALRDAAKASQKVDSLFQVNDSLKTVNTALQKKVVTSVRKTEVIQKGVDLTKEALQTQAITLKDSNVFLVSIVAQQDQVIAEQDVTIDLLHQSEQNLLRQIDTKDSVISVITVSNDSLIAVVKSIPKPDKCKDKFLFCKLPKPTRAMSFAGGVVTGTALALSGLAVFPK